MDIKQALRNHPLTCANCGRPNVSTCQREHGMRECTPCWRETLRHGHKHGMHDDPAPGCPDCPQQAHEDDQLITCPQCGETFLYWQAGDHARKHATV